MAEIFNRNPSTFKDFNDLFSVLNNSIGFTSEQLQKLIENTNYLYNHLGLANVDIGNVNTIFTNGTLSDVEVSHREVSIGGETIDFFDFTFYIPTPKIETEFTSTLTQNINEVGMTLENQPIYDSQNRVIGYKFIFNTKLFDGNIDTSMFEEKSNKSYFIDINDPSNTTLYPSNQAVINYVDSKINESIIQVLNEAV